MGKDDLDPLFRERIGPGVVWPGISDYGGHFIPFNNSIQRGLVKFELVYQQYRFFGVGYGLPEQ